MGYRSEVALVIKKEDEEKLLAAIADYDKGIEDVRVETAKELLDYADKNENKDYIVYHWEGVKWYYHYRSVGFFTEKIMSNKYGIAYDFLSIGEDWDDVEEVNGLHSEILSPIVEQYISIDI